MSIFREPRDGKEAFIVSWGAIVAGIIAVRGALGLLPDFIRYDEYGDTRGLVVGAMYLLGIFAAGITINWFFGYEKPSGGSD